MILMIIFVIPRLNTILSEAGQQIPLYTKIIIGISGFLRDFGPFILIALVVGIVFLWRYIRTESGQESFSRFQISVPYVGSLYKKVYLARITDNLKTLLSSGVSMVRSLEISADVVGNDVYSRILKESTDAVKGGNSLSEIFSKYDDIPLLVSKMIKIGEETGKLNFMLETLARFYKREVDGAVETLVSLIEPIMIIVLGICVGVLLISILGPIYNISSAI
jgi:type IV pilus assembly protein PilC